MVITYLTDSTNGSISGGFEDIGLIRRNSNPSHAEVSHQRPNKVTKVMRLRPAN